MSPVESFVPASQQTQTRMSVAPEQPSFSCPVTASPVARQSTNENFLTKIHLQIGKYN